MLENMQMAYKGVYPIFGKSLKFFKKTLDPCKYISTKHQNK